MILDIEAETPKPADQSAYGITARAINLPTKQKQALKF